MLCALPGFIKIVVVFKHAKVAIRGLHVWLVQLNQFHVQEGGFPYPGLPDVPIVPSGNTNPVAKKVPALVVLRAGLLTSRLCHIVLIANPGWPQKLILRLNV